jgi:hypothetical protein
MLERRHGRRCFILKQHETSRRPLPRRVPAQPSLAARQRVVVLAAPFLTVSGRGHLDQVRPLHCRDNRDVSHARAARAVWWKITAAHARGSAGHGDAEGAATPRSRDCRPTHLPAIPRRRKREWPRPGITRRRSATNSRRRANWRDVSPTFAGGRDNGKRRGLPIHQAVVQKK